MRFTTRCACRGYAQQVIGVTELAPEASCPGWRDAEKAATKHVGAAKPVLYR